MMTCTRSQAQENAIFAYFKNVLIEIIDALANAMGDGSSISKLDYRYPEWHLEETKKHEP